MRVELSESVNSVGRADLEPLVAQVVHPEGIADSHECLLDAGFRIESSFFPIASPTQ
jgi:hypothetical protein